MAATVPMEKAGDVNPLLEAANKIGLDETHNDDDGGGKAAAPEGTAKGNSYEAFMATFGNPSRWAGRS